MIPAPGEIYQHRDGTTLLIQVVDLSPGMEVLRVEFVVGTALCEANAQGWKDLWPELTLVKPEPEPAPIPGLKLNLINPIVPSLKMLQALEKEFAMAAGDIELGYIWREDVTVLVARGDMAPILKEIGLRIHKEILKQKNNGTHPHQN